MKNGKGFSIFEHLLPQVFFDYPKLIYWVYFMHWLLHSRVRVSKKVIEKYLKTAEFSNLLDLGCGEGSVIIPFSKKYSSIKFTGIDQNQRLVDFVNKFSHSGSNLSAKRADLNSLILKEKFDICTCIAVLQYLENQDHVIKQVYNSLSNGGAFILNVPIQKLRDSNSKKRIVGYDDFHGVHNTYDQKKLEDLLLKSGFSIESKKATNGKFGTLGNSLTNWNVNRIEQGNLFSKLIHAAIFAISFPFILILNILNDILPKNSISGIVIVARKF